MCSLSLPCLFWPRFLRYFGSEGLPAGLIRPSLLHTPELIGPQAGEEQKGEGSYHYRTFPQTAFVF